MTGKEIDEHLKSGKRFVMFGDPVYYYPEENKTEPYKWYREGMAQAEIAIESCTEEEFDSSRYNAEKLRHENDLLKQQAKELEELANDMLKDEIRRQQSGMGQELVALKQRVKELEEALRTAANSVQMGE